MRKLLRGFFTILLMYVYFNHDWWPNRPTKRFQKSVSAEIGRLRNRKVVLGTSNNIGNENVDEIFV